MKYILPTICLLLLSTPAGIPECNLLTNTDIYWPSPEVDKPAYLVPITDPVFGTTVTRITGNPGEEIPNISNEVWDDEELRHGYSKRQPWNCDQSMIFLDRHSPELWLDGSTYEVLFTRDKPGSRVRWSQTEPEIMYYISSPDSGDSFIGKWNVVTNEQNPVVDLTGYTEVTFGKGEGNFTNDGSRVAISAIRKSDSHEVIFAVNVASGNKKPDMDMYGLAEEINNCTISPLGNYIVIAGDWGLGSDRLQVRNAVTGAVLYTETERGMPSHFDVQIDQNGDEVVVGVAKTSVYGVRSGTVIKRILSNGDISVICDHKYASHTSGRALNRQGWIFVTYQNRDTNYPPYLNELVAVKLDGSRTERISHLHSIKFNYVSESHGVPSPDGLRVLWASNWDTDTYPIQAYVADYRDTVIAK
ncbi:MAG TPA: hypothetical protein EYP35_10805 [Desulfobacterales bacterium]|nr:hypothetical protein [Desulfobacterales bacterium]